MSMETWRPWRSWSMIDGLILALIATMYAAAWRYAPEAPTAVADRLGGGVLEVLLVYVFSLAFRAIYFLVTGKRAYVYYMIAILALAVAQVARWAPSLEQAITGAPGAQYPIVYVTVQWSALALGALGIHWAARRRGNGAAMSAS